MEVSEIGGHVTWELRISESFPDLNQALKNSNRPKMSVFFPFLTLVNPGQIQSPSEFSKLSNYSF